MATEEKQISPYADFLTLTFGSDRYLLYVHRPIAEGFPLIRDILAGRPDLREIHFMTNERLTETKKGGLDLFFTAIYNQPIEVFDEGAFISALRWAQYFQLTMWRVEDILQAIYDRDAWSEETMTNLRDLIREGFITESWAKKFEDRLNLIGPQPSVKISPSRSPTPLTPSIPPTPSQSPAPLTPSIPSIPFIPSQSPVPPVPPAPPQSPVPLMPVTPPVTSQSSIPLVSPISPIPAPTPVISFLTAPSQDAHYSGHPERVKDNFTAYFFLRREIKNVPLMEYIQQLIRATPVIIVEEKADRVFLRVDGEELVDNLANRRRIRGMGLDPSTVERITKSEMKQSEVFDLSGIDQLSDDNDWFSVLIRSQEGKQEIVGYAKGNRTSEGITHLAFVEISPRLQGYGLCTHLISYCFRQLRDHGFDNIELTNVGGEAGNVCYRRAAQREHLSVTCLNEACDKMRFS
jgi:ribosomal protein S18 acetylase RimI-like enzyme